MPSATWPPMRPRPMPAPSTARPRPIPAPRAPKFGTVAAAVSCMRIGSSMFPLVVSVRIKGQSHPGPAPPSPQEQRPDDGDQRTRRAQSPESGAFAPPVSHSPRDAGAVPVLLLASRFSLLASRASLMLVLHQPDKHRAQQGEDIRLQERDDQFEEHHAQHYRRGHRADAVAPHAERAEQENDAEQR